MNTLKQLRPTEKHRLIDLVESVGIDVSEWYNTKGGRGRAASNPKFCYDWAFEKPNKLILLNIWYSHLDENRGKIFSNISLNPYLGASPNALVKERSRKLVTAIRTAYAKNLPVRVVLLEGIRRDRNAAISKASKVKARMLDSEIWHVSALNESKAEAILVRGYKSKKQRYLDQFDSPEYEAQKVPSIGTKFQRNPKVRAFALQRAAGRCEWCKSKGFELPNGDIYLETHHIIPLAEEGKDSAANVIVLCPNHHREAHYGMNRLTMRSGMLRKRKIKTN